MFSRLVLSTLMLAMGLVPGIVWGVDTEAHFYVAPGGNDAWSGRLAEPNAEGTDGPLATIQRARDLVAQSKPTAPTRVLIRGGVYRLDKPLVFTPEHSGTKDAPITYAAYPGEKPIFSGGMPITGWTKAADGPLWTTVVPAVKEGKWYFRQLFVDGRRAVPARTPNDTTFRSAGPGVPYDNRRAARSDPKTKKSLLFHGDDIRPWSNLDDAVVVVYHSWTTSRHVIQSIDAEKKRVEFTAPSSWPMGYWEKNQRYYVEFVREALDAPGEWYLDRTTGELTYYPRPGEDMTTAEVIAPVAEELLQIQGELGKERYIEHLRFEGLSFQHTDWTMPPAESVDGQAMVSLETAAVRALGARHCVWNRCEVAHVGSYAVWLQNGCKDNRLVECHAHDLGAGGVMLGERPLPSQKPRQAERNEVYNCFIHDGGCVYHGGVGIWIGKSSHNHVHHNEICDFDYSGMSVGWMWGYAPSMAHHNRVEFNHIHHLGRGQLSDLGGIYHLGVAPGTVLRNNLIHHVWAYSYGGWGLYTDEGSTDVLMENNVVYAVKDGAFHQHYGRDNILRNNILALSATLGQITRSREEDHNSFTIEGNIIFGDTTPPLGKNWSNGHFTLKNNVYWNTDPATLVFPGDRDFAQWQTEGHDVGSVVADPKFADPQNGDFRMAPDSPAWAAGFKPIDLEAIGLVGSAEWVDLPQRIERPEPWFGVAKEK